MISRIWVFLISSIVIVYSCSSNSESTKNASFSNIHVTVADAVLPVVTSFSQRFTSTGTFIAEDHVSIAAETGGRITQLNFQEGEYKREGVLLATINDAPLQAEKSKLEIDIRYAEKELERAKVLEKIQAVTQEEVDRMTNILNGYKADLKVLNTQIDQTKVYAPFSGNIGVRLLSEGAYVSQGTPIVELYKLNPVKLEFFVPEKYVGSVNVGDKITFTIPSTKDTFDSKVYMVSPTMGEANRSLRVRCRVKNDEQQFVPGGYAEVHYGLGGQSESLLIPAEAIIPMLEGQKVLIVENGKVTSRSVEVGVRTNKAAQVVSGINESDTVLVSGILSLSDGMSVKPRIKDIL